MKYKNTFNEEGMNEIRIPSLKGQEMPDWYDGDILDFMDMETYYYELYLIADDEDGLFDHAEVYKVSGAENDDVHGSCDYEELNSDELKEIVEFIAGLFENE